MLEDEDSEAERTAGFLKLQEADLIAIFNQVRPSSAGGDRLVIQGVSKKSDEFILHIFHVTLVTQR